MSHKFGADPYALVYEDRVYLYMTNDILEYDANGNVKENSYGKINKISVISSDDLVNWTDHGEIFVAGSQGAAKWATQSWAPAIAHKVIDGEDKFFLYFANNASNTGVLTSDSPMGPWKYEGTILKNPGYFFGVGGNNHHAIFEFKGVWYIAYHSQTLAKAMGIPKGYRSTHLNQVFFNDDGTIQEITADYKGVEQLKEFDPYTRVEAETFAWSAGIETKSLTNDNLQQIVVTDIDDGDWVALSKVDFGNNGPHAFTAVVSNVNADSAIELRLDSVDGELVGTLLIPSNDGESDWVEVTTKVSGFQGVHDLYLVFRGEPDIKLFDFDYWYFSK